MYDDDNLFFGFVVLTLFIIVISLFGLMIYSINNDSVNVATRRVLPKRNVTAAAEFVTKQMSALGNMKKRTENEDYDDFLEQANENALSIYGVDTLGIIENSNFIPYDNCSDEQKNKIKSRK
jgi:hypothetical protein